VVVLGLAWMVMPAGMLIAPQLWGIWSISGGMAQAAFFTAIMSVVIRRSRSIDENRRTTSTMQTVGYSTAAAGPVVAGWVHQQVGGWSAPFAIILGVTVLMLIAATLAVRTPMPDAVRG
jgi:CP family cyanate transporter-like MFS transporter